MDGTNSTGPIDVVMAPVDEREYEDQTAHQDSSDDFSSHSAERASDANKPKAFSLAKSETEMINYSKKILVVVVSVVAVTVSCVTYGVVKSQETSEYENKFRGISSEIREFSQLKGEQVFNNLERYGATLTSYALDKNQSWPFVVFPDFQVRGILSNRDTGAHTISINPLVTLNDLDAWSAFTVDNQGWMAEAHFYDHAVHPDLYEVGNYETSYNHDESVRWDKTGITPYVWAKEEDDRYARPRVGKSLLYTPIWQRAPACDYATQVNMDYRSNPTFTDVIDGMLAVNHPVITEVVDATYLETNYKYRFDPEEQAEPHSYILEPVYDKLTKDRAIVAYLAAFIRWGIFFTDVLPSTENGIFVVLESSCGQTFTYEIFGHRAVYIGEGDQHENELDLEVTFEFSPESQLEKGGVHQFCHYYAHVFPSKQWRDQFYTSRPYTYAAAVFCCFLVTVLGFVLYDILVQRRQVKVMKSAAKTDAIVTSLFPENVRDRLMEDQSEKVDAKRDANAIAATFLNNGTKKNVTALEDDNASAAIFGSRPIADLFPATTIMFGDLVGFTAWSSTREPTAVFTLLETLYHAFDQIAKRRRVFKVETVGDCYVAVTGVPMPCKDHAIVMGKFASECLHKMKQLVHKLETSLGPDTGDLNMRIGLHSGPVTAGVLRGDKGRFQLFGDTMNTASRMETTGAAGRIHISLETAEILMKSGKSKWITPREDKVIAKGKGALTTYWFRILAASQMTGSNLSVASSVESGDSMDSVSQASIATNTALNAAPSNDAERGNFGLTLGTLSSKQQRLVAWNVDMLKKALKQIMLRRASRNSTSLVNKQQTADNILPKGPVLDEVLDVLALPQFDAKTMSSPINPTTCNVPDKVVNQLTDMVARIAALYNDNPFHCFEHASHVTMSVTKLLSRIINPNETSTQNGTKDKSAEDLHDHTFGITSDPLTQFACIISALIHDADHSGVPNSTLVKEQHPLASKYNNKSVAEQNSVDLAWDIITSQDYKDLQECIYSTNDEFLRFRSIIVNVVMATDIMDRDLGTQRKARWEKAFAKQDKEEDADTAVAINRKATIVLEHLMQASDVSHTMQHWVVFKKWNERLFVETYQAFVEGRSERDPSQGWYQGELGFFDYYIIPLAKKLETCGVFGVSSHEYLSYAQANRREWEEKGERIVKEYLQRYHQNNGDESGKGGTPARRLSANPSSVDL